MTAPRACILIVSATIRHAAVIRGERADRFDSSIITQPKMGAMIPKSASLYMHKLHFHKAGTNERRRLMLTLPIPGVLLKDYAIILLREKNSVNNT